jgi:hypothetical protein
VKLKILDRKAVRFVVCLLTEEDIALMRSKPEEPVLVTDDAARLCVVACLTDDVITPVIDVLMDALAKLDT